MADQPKNIINESELPTDLEFVERAPIVTGSGAAPTQSFDRYQGAILSAPLGLDTDIARSQLPGANPAYRLMPASLAGNPATNASVQSTARKVIAATPNPPSSSGGSVSLDVPNIFTPIAQTITLPGTLAFSLASQPVGTFLGVNGFANAPYPDGSAVNTVSGLSASLSYNTPGQDLVLFFAAVDNTHGSALTGPGAGWTALPGIGYGSTSGVAYQTDPAGTVVSQSQSYTTSNSNFEMISIALLSIPYVTTPVITARGNGGGSFSSANVVGTPAVGEGLLAFALINNNNVASNRGDIQSVTDNRGNIWFKIASTQGVGNFSGTLFGTGLSLWFCPSPRTGVSTTFTFSAGTATVSASIGVVGITGLSPNAGIPTFSPINIGELAGILGVANGGTGSDLSGTGGTSEVLFQNTAGGTITVRQPDFSDLAGAAGATPARYNGNTLTLAGLVSEVANIDRVGQTAQFGPSSIYTTALVDGAGQYRLSWNAKVTTPATTSTIGPLTVSYTDPDGVLQTITAVAQNSAGTIETSDTGNSTTTVMIGMPLTLNCKANTNITCTFAYVSNAAATMQYNLHMRLEALG
jgi:hypothetical protein